MTHYQTGKDVLEQSRAFHKKLSQFYHILSNQTEKAKVKLLLDYLSRHERRMSEILGEYEADVSSKVLETWFQFTHKECDLSPFWDAKLTENMTTSEVIKLAMSLDQCLLETYRAMASNQTPEDVREVFENLLRMEEEEVHKLARAELELDDM